MRLMKLKIFCEECDLEVQDRGVCFEKTMMSCECRTVLFSDEQLENIDEIMKKNYKIFEWVRRKNNE